MLGLLYLLEWDKIYDCRYWSNNLWQPRAVLALLLFCAVKGIQLVLSHGPAAYNLKWRLAWTGITSVSKPGIFFLALAVYYGPVVILTAFLWRRYCRHVHQWGLGMTLCVILAFLQTLCSESRGLNNMFPLLVAPIMKVIDGLDWKRVHYGILAGLSIFASKFWLTMSVDSSGDLLTFPGQYLGMNVGPWMANSTYLVQGGAMLLIGLLIYGMFPLTGPKGT
ncbi:MAG TPA: hypothetical protein VNK04_07140 [Gemmataceae bacterium]|nr:hypothetical protein [Gemmataceae bacterium]